VTGDTFFHGPGMSKQAQYIAKLYGADDYGACIKISTGDFVYTLSERKVDGNRSNPACAAPATRVAANSAQRCFSMVCSFEDVVDRRAGSSRRAPGTSTAWTGGGVLRRRGVRAEGDQAISNCTSTLPRMEREYGQVWWAVSTSCFFTAASRPGRLTFSVTASA
jgi:hypothetical protein